MGRLLDLAVARETGGEHSARLVPVRGVDDVPDRLQIGEFAEFVGLSVPQLRRYDHLRLLEPVGRSAESGYRYYSHSQTGAARVIALLRSTDMPIAEIRRILSGADQTERRCIFAEHRARLEARLEEVRHLLDAVDALAKEDNMATTTETKVSAWLHLMPTLPVTDMDRSIAYYQEALGFWLNSRTVDGTFALLSSGEVEVVALVAWTGDGPPPPHSAYVYVEDPDALCADYQQAGADITEPVVSRSSGMRDFVIRDPDGHQFRIGRGDERLREVAHKYGLTADQIVVDPGWLERRKPRA